MLEHGSGPQLRWFEGLATLVEKRCASAAHDTGPEVHEIPGTRRKALAPCASATKNTMAEALSSPGVSCAILSYAVRFNSSAEMISRISLASGAVVFGLRVGGTTVRFRPLSDGDSRHNAKESPANV
jgi:hypothetical protein